MCFELRHTALSLHMFPLNFILSSPLPVCSKACTLTLMRVTAVCQVFVCGCPSVYEWVYCTSSFPGQVTVWNDNLAWLQMSRPKKQWQMTADYICRLSSRGLTWGGGVEIWNAQTDEDMFGDKQTKEGAVWTGRSVDPLQRMFSNIIFCMSTFKSPYLPKHIRKLSWLSNHIYSGKYNIQINIFDYQTFWWHMGWPHCTKKNPQKTTTTAPQTPNIKN